jgi:hypothetical protein
MSPREWYAHGVASITRAVAEFLSHPAGLRISELRSPEHEALLLAPLLGSRTAEARYLARAVEQMLESSSPAGNWVDALFIRGAHVIPHLASRFALLMCTLRVASGKRSQVLTSSSSSHDDEVARSLSSAAGQRLPGAAGQHLPGKKGQHPSGQAPATTLRLCATWEESLGAGPDVLRLLAVARKIWDYLAPKAEDLKHHRRSGGKAPAGENSKRLLDWMGFGAQLATQISEAWMLGHIPVAEFAASAIEEYCAFATALCGFVGSSLSASLEQGLYADPTWLISLFLSFARSSSAVFSLQALTVACDLARHAPLTLSVDAIKDLVAMHQYH